MKSRPDVLVVGGGLAGLATAALLQRGGREVLVLERAVNPGGLAQSPMLHGVPMNLGPHALYLGGPAEQVLEELGVEHHGFTPDPADGFFLVGGQLVPMPTSLLGLLGADWLSWKERWQLAQALRRALGLDPDASGKSLAQWLSGLPSPKVRATVEVLARVSTYTHAPAALSAQLAHRQMAFAFGPRAQGVRYLDGGWQHLVSQLSARVTLRAAAVAQVTPGSVVLDGGEVLEARDVVLALPLHAAAQLVDSSALRARAARAEPVRVSCLDVVLPSLPAPARRLALGFDEPYYFSVHSRPDAPGPVWFHAARYLGPLEAVEPAAARAQLEALVDTVQPGWRPLALDARFYPHLTVMDDVAREEVVELNPPLHLVSSVASQRFLLDGPLEAAQRLAERLTVARGKMAP